jgi:hypothetical protein
MITTERMFSMIRHTLTFLGGLLVSKGILTDVMLDELVGSILTLGGIIWSIFRR